MFSAHLRNIGGDIYILKPNVSVRAFYMEEQKNRTIICAVNILRNMLRGYTVEYPMAGASLLQTELA